MPVDYKLKGIVNYYCIDHEKCCKPRWRSVGDRAPSWPNQSGFFPVNSSTTAFFFFRQSFCRMKNCCFLNNSHTEFNFKHHLISFLQFNELKYIHIQTCYIYVNIEDHWSVQTKGSKCDVFSSESNCEFLHGGKEDKWRRDMGIGMIVFRFWIRKRGHRPFKLVFNIFILT